MTPPAATPGDDAVGACAAIVARADPARFRAAMAAPLDARRTLFPLYAFNAEVARAPWVTAEPDIARIRLQWWRDALDEIAEGRPVRRHEVATPLAAVLDPEGAVALDDLVVARHGDLERDAPADLAAILAYVDRTAGTLLWAAARLLGATDAAAVRDAGRAQGVAGLLLAVPALVERGRHPLPHGDPASHAASLAAEGLAALRRARRAGIAPAARPALLVLPEAEAVLRRYAAHPESVLVPPPEAPPLRARLALALRAMAGRP